MASDEERARELIAAFELDLGWAHPRDRLWDDGEREKLAERIEHALAAVREAALREAADAVNAVETPNETTDANIGELRGLCRAEMAVRKLLVAPPPPPTKGTP